MPLAGWALWAFACTGPTGSTDSAAPTHTGATDDTGGTTDLWTWSGTATLTDAQQFAYESSLELPVVELAQGADSWIDWSGLSTDMLGLPLDPAQDVDSSVVAWFGTLSRTELATAIAHDSLPQTDLVLYASCAPGAVAGCALSTYDLFGNPINAQESFYPGEGTWLAAISAANEDGAVRYQSLLALEPSATATNERATFEEGACRFEVEVDLDAGLPIKVPEGAIPPLDWSGLTVDGRGAALALQRVDRIRVARFDSLDLATLEGRLAELDQLADESWRWGVTGTTEADLHDLPDGGSAFPGFSADGLWLLSLECSICTSPMPLFVGVVEPVAD